MTAPDAVLKLIERYNEQIEDYRRSKYKEAQVRNEFIDPLFAALGWDVHNKQGYAEAYKEVIHEDSLTVGGDTTTRYFQSVDSIKEK
jgi:predicted type IV restriction endonuclease